MIEAFRLAAVARGKTIWEGLDLSLGEGDLCVVTGPPAGGKSLLLRTLRGARRPEGGDVVVGGESLYRGRPEGLAAFRARSGVVSESPLSVEEGGGGRTGRREGRGSTLEGLFRLSAIASGGIPARERKRRQEELLAVVGLFRPDGNGTNAAPGAGADPLSWEIASLSLSERARAALAAELLRGPKFLFADMLLANGGKEWSETLGGLLRALAREGTTVLLAERTLPERWPGLAPVPLPPGIPFLIYRSGGTGAGIAATPGRPPAGGGQGGEGAGDDSEDAATPPRDEGGDQAG